jgi:hypothetical protein
MFTLVFCLACLGENPRSFLDQINEQGVPVPGQAAVRLSKPLMSPGLTADEQLAVLKKASDKIPLELFLKNSLASPHAIQINSVENNKKRYAQTVDICFVAHGKIETLIKHDLLSQLLGDKSTEKQDARGKTTTLDDDELKKRDIKPFKSDIMEERFAKIELNILNQVQVSGVTRNIREQGPGWLKTYSILDDRFAKDADWPNQWRKIDAKAPAGKELGTASEYAGWCSFVQVTSLSNPEGALFVEVRSVYAEPHGWFDGYNVLRSKLPLAIKDNVTSFRRKLALAEKEKP